MKRTTTTRTTTKGRFTTLVTQNGVRTTTKPFYLKDYRDYTPRSDGYNVELAEAMWEQIRFVPSLWSQGDWRRVIVDDQDMRRFANMQMENEVLEDTDTDEAVAHIQAELDKAIVQHVKDSTEPACGTAMCAAGWITELSGIDFVVDFEFARWARKQETELGSLAEYVLVPKALVDERNKDYRDLPGVEYTSSFPISSTLGWAFSRGTSDHEKAEKLLAKRGFTEETHVCVTLASWAIWQLGLRDTDGEVPMFAGNNSMTTVRHHLDHYAVNGPWDHDPEEPGMNAIEVPWREDDELDMPLDAWLAKHGLVQHG